MARATPQAHKVALVTGGSRGIGAAIARKLAAAGADLVINHRKAGGSSQAKAEELCAEIRAGGSRALLVPADIAVKAAVKAMLAQVREEFGRLDFLILNAARAPFRPLENLPERELRQLVETNWLGNLFCVQEALSLLEASAGKVVFISSLGSRFYSPAYPLGSMKAAMEAAVRDLAEGLSGRGIAVNAVCAGLVKTDSFKLLRRLWEGLDRLPEEFFVEPEEIADVVLFLCGPGARGMRGQTVVVDRGLSNSLMRFPPPA
ncbi:MAG TPA: SDR family oxidoreductase [Candidatus Acidoferrales bacterium]|nr:SDR family oxidoreductase [Candidatus Acidoferrales bacterium]